MYKRRKLLISLVIMLAVFLLVAVFCNKKIVAAAQGKTFDDINAVPHNHVGLLLGTGKYLKGGTVNPYYRYRIDAAIQLLKAEKVDYLVISGDNSTKDYNEPGTMRIDLMNAGIDSVKIYLDYAGFRTFDSMIRLREIFSTDTVTVISQKFHNERALFIAQQEGITAVGFNARDVSASSGLRTQFREKFARIKVFTDYLLHRKPKFLGPKVYIP